jgi:hypothetical protein
MTSTQQPPDPDNLPTGSDEQQEVMHDIPDAPEGFREQPQGDQGESAGDVQSDEQDDAQPDTDDGDNPETVSTNP